MWYIWFLLGVLVGVIVVSVFYRLRSISGVLRIDSSNPEKDVYRFDVGDLDKLSNKKRIVLKVDKEADLSQK